jgi:heme-degrading monooxygenase HmoA
METPVERTHPGLFVATSELHVHPDASDELVGAFRHRAHLVDGRAGFERLEVWRDQRDRGRLILASWWADRHAFVDYMRSDDNRRSHARTPRGRARPRPVALTRFDVVAR